MRNLRPSNLQIILKGQLIVNLPVLSLILVLITFFISINWNWNFAIIVSSGLGWILWSWTMKRWVKWAKSKNIDAERLWKLGKWGLINFSKNKIYEHYNGAR